MTAKQALQHPWLQPTQFNVRSVDPSKNLMPNFKSNFDAKRKWKKAMDSVLFTQRVKIHNATSEAIKVAIEEDINPEIVVGSINLNDNTDNIEKLKKFTSSDFNTIDTIEDNKENKVKETARN